MVLLRVVFKLSSLLALLSPICLFLWRTYLQGKNRYRLLGIFAAFITANLWAEQATGHSLFTRWWVAALAAVPFAVYLFYLRIRTNHRWITAIGLAGYYGLLFYAIRRPFFFYEIPVLLYLMAFLCILGSAAIILALMKKWRELTNALYL